MEIKCPKCHVQFDYYKSDFRPFCSNKCKMIDLGKWLNEEYVISRSIQDEDLENETEDKFNEK